MDASGDSGISVKVLQGGDLRASVFVYAFTIRAYLSLSRPL